jgi:oxygen-independent coproporphyrinogen III oxidase
MNKMLALAERSVPRYTSYPTAPHFSADIGRQIYADWLDAVPEAATLSIYLHVPFCTELCRYCGCSTKAMRRRPPVDAYAKLLHAEIELLSAAIRARASLISTGAAARINPRSRPSRSPRRQVDRDLRLHAPAGTCNRA